MRVLLIHNPGAGPERPSAKKLSRAFENAGHEIRCISAKETGWKKALEEPQADVVVAAGGDGTVRRVALALASNGNRMPLAILPMGTANNVARAVGAEGDETRVATGLETARKASLSIGRVCVPGGAAARFVESAGLGVFGRMLRKAEDDDVDTMEEGLELLRRLVKKAKPLSLVIEADGTDLSGNYLMVEAMNIPSIGAQVLLAPWADHADSSFELVLITEAEREAVLEYLESLQGEVPLAAPVKARRVSRLKLSWEPGCGHVDDRPWPSDGDEDREIHEVRIDVERHLPLLIP